MSDEEIQNLQFVTREIEECYWGDEVLPLVQAMRDLDRECIAAARPQTSTYGPPEGLEELIRCAEMNLVHERTLINLAIPKTQNPTRAEMNAPGN